MADSICAYCFHNYVCEKFNENRGYKNQECRYFDWYKPDYCPNCEAKMDGCSNEEVDNGHS